MDIERYEEIGIDLSICRWRRRSDNYECEFEIQNQRQREEDLSIFTYTNTNTGAKSELCLYLKLLVSSTKASSLNACVGVV